MVQNCTENRHTRSWNREPRIKLLNLYSGCHGRTRLGGKIQPRPQGLPREKLPRALGTRLGKININTKHRKKLAASIVSYYMSWWWQSHGWRSDDGVHGWQPWSFVIAWRPCITKCGNSSFRSVLSQIQIHSSIHRGCFGSGIAVGCGSSWNTPWQGSSWNTYGKLRYVNLMIYLIQQRSRDYSRIIMFKTVVLKLRVCT